MKTLLLALLALPFLSGCGPTPPDERQVEISVGRSKDVQAETQKRVDDTNKALSGN